MEKKNLNNTDTTNNKNQACDHVQLGGMAYYDERKYFMFAPDDPVPNVTKSFRGRGIAQCMSDGSFDFVAKPKPHTKSLLIRKLAHGRVSKSYDNAVYLTLKIYCDEGINISNAILEESKEAADGVKDFQLKR